MKEKISKVLTATNRIVMDFVLFFIFEFILLTIQNLLDHKIDKYARINHEPAPIWLKGIEFVIIGLIVVILVGFILSIIRNIMKQIKYDTTDPRYYERTVTRLITASIFANVGIVFKSIIGEVFIVSFIFVFINELEHSFAVALVVIIFLVVIALLVLKKVIVAIINSYRKYKYEDELIANELYQNNNTLTK